MGPLTTGLLNKLRRRGSIATVSEAGGPRTDARVFARTVERAAMGLASRGVWPGDVVAILAPVSPARLTAVYTVLAVGGVALPLEKNGTIDTDTQIEVLTETDTRLLLVTSPLATAALEMAERSRVRQVIAFGSAPETTPFEELLESSADSAPRCPAHDAFDSGIVGYQATGGGVVTTLYGQADLLDRFRQFDAELDLRHGDVVAVESGMPEPSRTALAALALWHGVSVVTIATESEPEIRRVLATAGATVRGAPVPTRVATRN
ncbi:acyl-CoA synthetase (AMP-forming)/AMP-acid ligase II [Lipingzhangella halophila]|uniref:Acyl-CoA synthetase (AMP-forming)/AMP-acid ligase II n=1 Tax=Lipingzhangella halophila TaxID=1783352 RepID=A0A7W7W462_9ACTN|nr:AMP-binding protein [Lipingzhangella halophila]MBB4933481.1 acyl-CoA synthetase (AMP-forming)/AMP-acid ligase II [Lipingzhangella halophila]